MIYFSHFIPYLKNSLRDCRIGYFFIRISEILLHRSWNWNNFDYSVVQSCTRIQNAFTESREFWRRRMLFDRRIENGMLIGRALKTSRISTRCLSRAYIKYYRKKKRSSTIHWRIFNLFKSIKILNFKKLHSENLKEGENFIKRKI